MHKLSLVLLLCLSLPELLAKSKPTSQREWTCSHKEEYNQYNRYRIKPGPRLSQQSANAHITQKTQSSDTFSEQFKMYVYYDDSVNSGLSSNVRNRIKNTIMPNLTHYFNQVLSVRPLKGPILVDRECVGGSYLITNTDVRYCSYQCDSTTECGTVTVPSAHLKRCAQCNGVRVLSSCTEIGSDGPGVDASFLLYVSAKTAGSCPTRQTSEGTVAYAGSCGMEDEYDRPIVGYANFCPYSLNDDVTDDFIVAVAKHEILHALGFSNGQYAFWRDENGKPRTQRDSNGKPPFDGRSYVPGSSTFKEVTYTNWDTRNGGVTHSVYQLVTPKIVQEGRNHFGCSSLQGVEVENQGGSGTALSHWEKRILENEGMTGIVSHNPKFSRLTFALLEDSGWYKVNYNYAQQLLWGSNSGCDFASGSCKQYMTAQKQKKKSISPFCDYLFSSNGEYGCTFDRSAVSHCDMVQYTSSLPNEYQYFDSGSNFDAHSVDVSAIGGQTQIADFCPYQSAFSNSLCKDPVNSKGTGLSNSLAETYGPGSRCIVHGTPWKAEENNRYIQQPASKSGCYQYTCSEGKVIIHILDKAYICSSKGQEIKVSQTTGGVTYTGSIICPACTDICYDYFKGCPEAETLYRNASKGLRSSSSVLKSPGSYL